MTVIRVLLGKYWPYLAILAALGVLWALHGSWERTAYNRAYNAGWSVEHAAHLQTVANYRAAADEAARLDKANVERVKSEQTAITERTVNAYEADIAAARARADALRVQLAAKANPGSTSATSVPAPGSAASGTDAAAPQEEFSVADRLVATEQAIQLEALQDWARAQSKVDVGNAP